MITGIVRNDEPRIRLCLRGPRGQQQAFEAVIDTGYTGWLTIPHMLVVALGLPWQSNGSCTLADGTTCDFDVYEATVVWDRRARQINVDEADTVPLVGMSLMKGYHLDADLCDGGRVILRRLTGPRRAD